MKSLKFRNSISLDEHTDKRTDKQTDRHTSTIIIDYFFEFLFDEALAQQDQRNL